VILLKKLSALALVIGLVAGVPALLVLTVGNPLPTKVPTIDEITAPINQGGDQLLTVLMSAIAIFVWLIWAQLVVSLVSEVVALRSERQTSTKLPVAPGIQTVAARLVATIALSATLSAGPLAGLAGVAATTAAVVVDTPTAVAMVPAEIAEDPPEGVSGSEPSVELALTDDVDLWSLSEALHGDGAYWRNVVKLNADRTTFDGKPITGDLYTLSSGTVLALDDTADLAAAEQFGTVVNPARLGDGGSTADTTSIESIEALSDFDQGPDLGNEPTPLGLAAVPTWSPDEPTNLEQVTVAKGDTLWSLSEAAMAQPDPSDAEILEVVGDVIELNQSSLQSGNPDLVYPGEEILVPRPGHPASEGEGVSEEVAADPEVLEQSATETNPLQAASTESADTETAVQGVEGGAAEQRVGESHVDAVVEEAAPAPQVAPSAEQDSAAAAATADLSAGDEPKQHDVDRAEELVGVAADGSLDLTRIPEDISPTVDSGEAGSADDATSGNAVGAGLVAVGAAMLSMGTVGALRRRRNLQRRVRPEGAIAVRPSTEAEAFEAAMRHASDQLRESALDGGWRALPSSTVEMMRQSGPLHFEAEASGQMKATSLDAQSNQVTIDLTADGDPTLIAEMLDTDVPDEVDDGSPASTTLIVGTSVETGQAVLLDLASVSQVDLVGDPGEVRRFARSAVLDLATSERADDLQVIAAGLGSELADLERVHCTDGFQEALVVAAESSHIHDPATPVIIVSGADTPPTDEQMRRVSDLGILLVAAGLDSPAAIRITGERAELQPAGTSVVLASLPDDDFRAVAELVEVTRASAVEVAEQPITDHVDVPAGDECPIKPGTVDVQVLGPVQIEGAKSFSSLKATDVVTYLAFHRNGADADQIKSWVWPPFEPPTDKALANVMSRARTGLGVDDDGQPLLSRAGADKMYRLDSAVTTDFDRFRALVALADEDDDPSNQLHLLKAALELIRGVPFSGGGASSFAWADNHVRAQVEFTIDEAVHRCADLALQLDDLGVARWAALKGLELVPGCEQCFRRRFLVASADNNRSELRRAMADLERSASLELGEPEAVDLISGDLLDLFHTLDRALVQGSV